MLGPGTLICFEGIDASGKTTTAVALSKKFAEQGVKAFLIEKKDTLFPTTFLASHMTIIKKALWDYPKDEPIGDLGNHHWIMLMASWFSVLDHTLIRPAILEGSVVLLDSWYNKFLLRFLQKNIFNLEYLESFYSHLTVPTATILLDVSPEIAFKRREVFHPTETGGIDGYKGANAFVEYQTKIREGFHVLAKARQWLVVENDVRGVEQTVEHIWSLLGVQSRGVVTHPASRR